MSVRNNYNLSEGECVDSGISDNQNTDTSFMSLSDLIPHDIYQPFGLPFVDNFLGNLESINIPSYQLDGNFDFNDFPSSSPYPLERVTNFENLESVESWTVLEANQHSTPVSNNRSTVTYLNEETATTSTDIFPETPIDSEESESSTEAKHYESVEFIVTQNLSKKESKTEARRRLCKEKQIEKHSVKEGCTCAKTCSLKISHARRIEINGSFNRLDDISKKLFIRGKVNSVKSSDPTKTQRNEFFFTNDLNELVNVCMIFFITTLGFNPTNTTYLRAALSVEFPAETKRGKYSRTNEVMQSNVNEHIMSFDPQVSHYRREHAPNRLYLPSDVTIGKMHSIFNEAYPDTPCSYEYYRKTVEKMNISFTKLGQEKCEDCEKYIQHELICVDKSNCSVCVEYIEHKQRYDKARIEYGKDKQLPYNPKHIRASTDQQKVVMLPRIEQFKEVLFTNRLRAFNQTFAPLGSTKHNPVFACIWHDGIAGKEKEEVVSCYHAFLLKHRDAEEITIWCDNCSAQNKCWALFSFFVYIVNSTEIAAKRINIKYLQKGHTFMSADSFHHQVELSTKNRKDSAVYDFKDFLDCVQNSNDRRNYCKEMNFFDFAEWPDWYSAAKLNKCNPRPYVHDFTKLMFVRGKKTMFYANDFDDEFIELDFIMTKELQLNRPPLKVAEKGIPNETKKGIVQKLTPLMPPSRRHFWENLK